MYDNIAAKGVTSQKKIYGFNGDIYRFLHPGNSTDPAYHIVIKVKDCELKDCN